MITMASTTARLWSNTPGALHVGFDDDAPPPCAGPFAVIWAECRRQYSVDDGWSDRMLAACRDFFRAAAMDDLVRDATGVWEQKHCRRCAEGWNPAPATVPAQPPIEVEPLRDQPGVAAVMDQAKGQG